MISVSDGATSSQQFAPLFGASEKLLKDIWKDIGPPDDADLVSSKFHL